MTNISAGLGVAGAALLVLLAGCGDGAEPTATVVTQTVTATPTTSTPTPSASESTPPAAATSSAAATPSSAAPADAETFGPYTAPATAGPSIVDSGYSVRKSLGDWFAHTGAVLYNNGPSASFEVVFQGIHNDQVVDSSTESVFVQADSFFVAGTVLTELKSREDTVEVNVVEDISRLRIRDVDLVVEAALPQGKNYQNVPLSITNSGSQNLPANAGIHLVQLNASGDIVGGDSNYLSLPIPAGQTVRDVVDSVYMPPGTVKILGYVNLLRVTS